MAVLLRRNTTYLATLPSNLSANFVRKGLSASGAPSGKLTRKCTVECTYIGYSARAVTGFLGPGQSCKTSKTFQRHQSRNSSNRSHAVLVRATPRKDEVITMDTAGVNVALHPHFCVLFLNFVANEFRRLVISSFSCSRSWLGCEWGGDGGGSGICRGIGGGGITVACR
eukprot:scaffold208894_cov31-Tisochrysis_lutea.AAC.1